MSGLTGKGGRLRVREQPAPILDSCNRNDFTNETEPADVNVAKMKYGFGAS